MQINVGEIYVREPIVNAKGELLGTAIYNPRDPGVLTRTRENEELLREADRLYEEFSKTSDEDALEKAHGCVRAFCNKVFSEDFYDSAFGRCSPFALFEDGTRFFLAVIGGVSSNTREYIDNMVKKSEKKKEKYLKEYDGQ